MVGETNFRDRLDLLYCAYKSDRDPAKKPIKLSEIKELIKKMYYCEIAEDEEADDIISRYQYLSSKEVGKYIVISPDKDCKQTPGFVYNPQKDEIRNCSGFGYIELIVKKSASGSNSYKIDGVGRCFFYWQLIGGDLVDSYYPFKPAKTPYRFYQEFKDIKNDKEAWQYVYNSYKSYFGDIEEWIRWDGKVIKGDIIDLIQVYVDVVHMIRWNEDSINVRDVLKKMEVVP